MPEGSHRDPLNPFARTVYDSSLTRRVNDIMTRVAQRGEICMATESEHYAAPLEDVVELVQSGPWRFLQLRGTPPGRASINSGDVDMLGTADSVRQLLDAAFDWACTGHGHVVVRARSDNKISLTFVSLDAKSWIAFDLWVTLWQLDSGKTALTYEDCVDLALPATGAIQRLPPSIEVCIYAQHLNVKNKNLDSASVRERLSSYHTACLRGGETELAEAVNKILKQRKLDGASLEPFRAHLQKAGLRSRTPRRSRWLEKIANEFAAAWLDGPRPMRHVTITGGDGSGKTSLARMLRARDPMVTDLSVGKRLYRNSILYKILVIFLRPLFGSDKNRFDDRIAPFAYMRASCALRVKTWLRRSGLELIDRSIVDFLIVDRKSDNPRFHALSWLSSAMGVRIPAIHLVVPHHTLQSRKRELTEPGQRAYDRLVFQHFTRRRPTAYALFFNGMDLPAAADAMSALLRIVVGGRS